MINKEWAPSVAHAAADVQPAAEDDVPRADGGAAQGTAPIRTSRLNRSLWYTTYNRDNLRVDFTGATPFWRAAYAHDVPAMKLLLAYGAEARHSDDQAAGHACGAADATARRATPRQDPSGLRAGSRRRARHPADLAAAGVGYGQGYAANDHRHAPDGWLPAVKFLVEELHADVNARDFNGFTALHFAAARGDNEMIKYLVSKGADVKAVARNGQTTADMANGPVQRISPFLDTVALLESLGAKNNHKCVSC